MIKPKPLTKEDIEKTWRIAQNAASLIAGNSQKYEEVEWVLKESLLDAKQWMKTRLNEEEYLNHNIDRIIDEAFNIK